MKTIILNGSPRKNWNTAQVLQSVRKGAESVGAVTEYIDLYDLTYRPFMRRSSLLIWRKRFRWEQSWDAGSADE